MVVVITAIHMNSTFKVHMVSVLSLGFDFIEEIEPCQIEIQNVSIASSVKFKIWATGHFNLPVVLCFSLAR